MRSGQGMCFNLVIEKLMIPTLCPDVCEWTVVWTFQSRNRETYDSNKEFPAFWHLDYIHVSIS